MGVGSLSLQCRRPQPHFFYRASGSGPLQEVFNHALPLVFTEAKYMQHVTMWYVRPLASQRSVTCYTCKVLGREALKFH